MNTFFAALTLFTRLPVRRKIPPESFARAVDWWPAVGLLTGGVAAGVLWFAAAVFPPLAAAAMALGARMLLTGAFHEDGLGDFFDGMGGGRTRERTLEIMKDSRTGSYGVVGLALYFLVATALVSGLPRGLAVAVVFVGDPLSKAVTGQLVNILPYARPAAESKTGSYRRMSAPMAVTSLIIGFAPLIALSLAAGFAPSATPALAALSPVRIWLAAAAPAIVVMGLGWLMWRRLGGYTGDCLGAAFLLCEAAFWAGIWLVMAA